MTVFVPDTHALIWRLIEPARLAAAATRAFDQADAGQAEMQVPAVVLAEMVMVAEKDRVASWGSAEVGAFVQAAQDSSNYRLSSLTPEVVMFSAGLVSIPDIFDRLIAAESLIRGATLISRDRVFTSLSNLPVAWD